MLQLFVVSIFPQNGWVNSHDLCWCLLAVSVSWWWYSYPWFRIMLLSVKSKSQHSFRDLFLYWSIECNNIYLSPVPCSTNWFLYEIVAVSHHHICLSNSSPLFPRPSKYFAIPDAWLGWVCYTSIGRLTEIVLSYFVCFPNGTQNVLRQEYQIEHETKNKINVRSISDVKPYQVTSRGLFVSL